MGPAPPLVPVTVGDEARQEDLGHCSGDLSPVASRLGPGLPWLRGPSPGICQVSAQRKVEVTVFQGFFQSQGLFRTTCFLPVPCAVGNGTAQLGIEAMPLQPHV